MPAGPVLPAGWGGLGCAGRVWGGGWGVGGGGGDGLAGSGGGEGGGGGGRVRDGLAGLVSRVREVTRGKAYLVAQQRIDRYGLEAGYEAVGLFSRKPDPSLLPAGARLYRVSPPAGRAMLVDDAEAAG